MSIIQEIQALSPYPSLRPGQLRIAKEVYQAIVNGHDLVIEAPCGLGKTLACLMGIAPPIKSGLVQKVLWLTRTNNESDKIINEAKKLKIGGPLRGLSIRGRSHSCLYIKGTSEDILHLACKTLRNENLCPYLNQERIDEAIESIEQNYELISSVEIVELCHKLKACPFIVMKKLALRRNLIALTYPYFFNRNVRKAYVKSLFSQAKNVVVIIDEAHNLLEALPEYNTRRVKLSTILNAVDELYIRDQIRLARPLEDIAFSLEEMVKNCNMACGVEIPLNLIERPIAGHGGEVTSYLSELKRVAREIIFTRAIKGLSVRCYTLSIYLFLKELFNSSQDMRMLWAYNEIDSNSITIELRPLYCNITPLLQGFRNTIFMSGTLSPISRYLKLIGLRDRSEEKRLKVVKYLKPQYGRVFLIIDKSVSTSLKSRSQTLFKKLLYKLKILRNAIKGGLGIFAASYNILQGLLTVGLKDALSGSVLVDDGRSSHTATLALLELFKDYVQRGFNATLVSVVGGRFSEGVDIPSSIMPIAVIVGLPLPEPTPYTIKKLEILKSMGFKDPHNITFIEPAMRKVIQTIGRLIRSPNDQATVILMDERYNAHAINRYMPKWLKYKAFVNDNPLMLLHSLPPLKPKVASNQ